jgi:hypothetical protein
MCPIPNGFRDRAILYYRPHKGKSRCTQTSNTHELRSMLMLTLEFSKMYFTR